MGAVAGAVMLGKKLIDHKDKIHSLTADIQEGIHTASEIRTQADSVSGVRSGLQATRQSVQEIQEAQQYRETRRDAQSRGVRMDARPTYQAKAKRSAREQGANVNLVAKAKCFADASKLKPKKREKAVKKCNEKFA